MDEWQISQLSDLFLIPFFQICRAAKGSTEGIIIFMRRVFLIVNSGFFCYFYVNFRYKRAYGLIAAAIFSSFIPWAMFTLNYYSLTPRLLMVVCVLLFINGDRLQEHPISKFKLLAAGTILSVAVLIEPPLSVLYLFYSISVLAFAIIRKKRSGFCERFAFFINLRCWFYISAAIFICAPVFIIFLAVKSGIGNIISAFPELLKDAEYDFSANGNVRNFLVSKIPRFAKIFGWHNLAAMILLCCAAIIYTKRKKTKHSFFMFFLSNFVLISCSAYPILSRLLFGKDGWADWMYYSATPFPLFAFGFVNYLLCRKKDPRLILIWFVGLFSSVLMDSFSDVSLGICGIICAVPGVFCFGDILEEYTEYKKQSLPQPLAERRKGEDRSARSFPRRIIKANDVCISLSKCAFALFLVVVCANTLFEGFYLYKEDPYKNENTSDLIRIECGPYRGIYTTKSNQDAMNRLCEDMETIKKMSDGPLFSEGFQPLIPLYLDMPYSNCTTWNLYQPRDRQLRYFAAHPEKTPDVIYYYENLSVKDSLPGSGEYSENAKTFIEFVNLLCDGTVTNGKAGIMIKVQKWKDPSDPELLAWVEEHKQIGESILQ